ncbi:hypothetical protein ACEXQB_011085 [Herbiconiux sp. P18]|uniref:hypothetical protein n=1 Tax=Herbiconiux liangxiaofengii TaxID=3342795 RepID=UPI0035B8B27E
MKNSRIARDLVGYVGKIMPSTPIVAVEAGGLHGVRVMMTTTSFATVLLENSVWRTQEGGGHVRIRVVDTYPLLTSYVAYLVSVSTALEMCGEPRVPVDEATLRWLSSTREFATMRHAESVGYLQQVAGDAKTPPQTLLPVRRSLTIIRQHVAELVERRGKPVPGPPTPAGPQPSQHC